MKQCRITISDEVNCRVQDIAPPTIRRCINALKFKIPYAMHLPSFKLGRWDGTVSFFTAGGQTQINLLERILPILEQESYDIELIDERPKFQLSIPQIDETIASDCVWPDKHPTNAGEPIIIKDHQVDIINNFILNLKGIQVIPTSGGKTICTAILSRLVQNKGRTIVIVPNKQLVNQTFEEYKLLQLDVGVYFGDQKDWGKKHTICTWQSLDRLYKDTKKDFYADNSIYSMSKDVVAVIVDEVHMAKADVLKTLLTKVFNRVPIRWGLTGTMPKEEYNSLSIIGSIGPIINTITAKELQDLGILSNCEIHCVQIQDDSKFRSYPEEYQYLVHNEERLQLLANFFTNIAVTGNTLILVNNVATGKKLNELIENSVFISGKVKVKDREIEYDQIADLDGRTIIATFGVAAVGINVPRLFNLIILEGGKGFIRTIQSIGRLLRRANDKDFATIYDICCSTKYSKKHLTERKKWYKEMKYPFQIIKIDKLDI